MSKRLSHCANAIAFHHAILELRAGGNESLACFIVLRVFIEVLDEALSEVFSLFFPFSRILVSILRVEDVRVNALKFRRNFQIEETIPTTGTARADMAALQASIYHGQYLFCPISLSTCCSLYQNTFIIFLFICPLL